MLGDVSLSAEDKPPDLGTLNASNLGASGSGFPPAPSQSQVEEDHHYYEDDEEEHHHFLEGHTALKFLLAGGVAGAGKHVPFSCLYLFLIWVFQCQGHARHLSIG